MHKIINRLPFVTSTRGKLIAAAILVIVFVLVFLGGSDELPAELAVAARRGPLQISVLEGGSIEARQAQEIRSEIKGYQGTKILSIVEEGYLVTDEDVRNGKVLVELDSSELKQRITTQEIQFQSTIASLTEATQAYEIQLNQNKTDIQAAEQKARFALMDIEKFLGAKVSTEILNQLGLPTNKFFIETNDVTTAAPAAVALPKQPFVQIAALSNGLPAIVTDAPPTMNLVPRADNKRTPPAENDASATAPSTQSEPSLPKVRSIAFIDFSQYAKAELLQGEAEQKLRKLADDLLVAQSEAKLAEVKRDGTKRLQEKDFVSKTELQNDELNYDKAALKVQTAKTALDLFIQYEFPRSAEEFVSKFQEALHGLERARKEAVSKLAQSEAKLRSAQGRFRIEDAQQKELQEQLEKSVIRAEKPGLVVYGSGGDRRFYGEDQIREGATVRERQPIITIPDMTQMAVRVKIHEAQIKKVKKGMKARIQIDAFPDESLEGEVAKVAVLPDSQDRWMNPDLKVYQTTINIDGTYEWVKPGMSAKVEILVNTLDDVIYVPLQAVAPLEGKHFCYVLANGGEPEQRQVEVGDFNDEFIVVKSGVKEGERVLLRAPAGADASQQNSNPTPEKSQPAQPSDPSGQST